MVARPVSIVPSVLPADFSRLGEECVAHYVPNLTFGPDVIASVRDQVTVPFEAHLMVNTPELMLQPYVDAGCELLIIHAESTVHLHRTLGAVAEAGARAAVALNPSTPIDWANVEKGPRSASCTRCQSGIAAPMAIPAVTTE